MHFGPGWYIEEEDGFKEVTMTEEHANQSMNRLLLARNPYFTNELEATREKLGLPSGGFQSALERLAEVLLHKGVENTAALPPHGELVQMAEQAGLPVDDFQSSMSVESSDASHILDLRTWSNWWLAEHGRSRGLSVDPEVVDLDPDGVWLAGQLLPQRTFVAATKALNGGTLSRLPIYHEALQLCGRFALGSDYALNVVTMLIGIAAPALADDRIIIRRRAGGTGVMVFIGNIDSSMTSAAWRELYRSDVKPLLDTLQGNQSQLGENPSRTAGGRPRDRADILDRRLQFWTFYNSLDVGTRTTNAKVFESFLDSLEEGQRGAYEHLEPDEFMRDVRIIDHAMRPTVSR